MNADTTKLGPMVSRGCPILFGILSGARIIGLSDPSDWLNGQDGAI